VRFVIPNQERIMRRIPNATFVNSRKRARSPCSDGLDAVHTYGSLSLSKGEGRVRIYSPTGDSKAPIRRARPWIAWINWNWRPSIDALPRLAAVSTLQALLETLTLVLSLSERERRAFCAVTLQADVITCARVVMATVAEKLFSMHCSASPRVRGED